MEIGPKHVAAD